MSRAFRTAAVIALICSGQEERAILAPPTNASFAQGPVRFIARGSKDAVKVDGKPAVVESPADGVVTASLTLAPGPHEVSVGAETVKFFLGADPAYKAFRPHPPTANCATCHAVKNGVWTFQRASLVTLCSQCHSKETFPAKHTHEMGIVADCQLCHDPHGSTAVAHLKQPKEVACKQCHS